MSIDLDVYNSVDAYGAVCCVDVRATISLSPREGFDVEKIGELERDLGPYISKRLNDALKRGGTK